MDYKRYLGLDLGTKTIGLSLSDKSGMLASSYRVLRHENNPESCLALIQEIITQEQVEALVLGYPKNMNNSIGFRAQATEQFKETLEKTVQLPVFLEDERLSTREAEQTLIAFNMRRKNRKEVIDAVAATIILQQFLDRRRK